MKLKICVRVLVILAFASLLTACRIRGWEGFPTTYDPRFVWPPPPETPKVAFILEIKSHEDLFQTAGMWNGIKELVAGPPDSTLLRPYALALHPDGGLLIADPGRHLVHFYGWGHRKYVAIGSQSDSGLPSPVGVAALPDGRILVSDSRLGKILTFSSDGKLGGDFCKSDAVERPAGIVVAPARREVYVADVTRHCIVVFDFGGAVLRTIGKRGDGSVEFNFPTHLALGPDGSLAVTDSMNFRVQTVTPEGKFVRSVGRLGDAPGTLSKPKGVALDSEGNTIVAEGLYGALEFFDPNGQLLLNLGASGHGPGEFWLPAGLLFDPEQRLLFVADSYNNRVQVFRMLRESAP